MVAIVSGNNLGLNLGSLALLPNNGQTGKATQGSNRESAYVDVSTGNLVLQDADSYLAGVGANTGTVRTYNSQGTTNFTNNDGWQNGSYKSVTDIGNNQLERTDSDGSTLIYTWDAGKQLYVADTSIGTALNTIEQVGDTFVWTNGSTGATETYQVNVQGSAGLISSATDTSGNTTTFGYDDANLLTSVTNADGETINYTYTGANLTAVSTSLQSGQVLNQVAYTYDSSNRLTSVAVNLDPTDASAANTYTTAYTYDGDSNRVASMTQSDGTTLSLTYVNADGAYKVATLTDGDGNVTQFAYNTGTNTTTVTDALGQTSAYQYDDNGALLRILKGVTASNAAGLSQVNFTYNSLGEVDSVSDGTGYVINYTYDDNGNLINQVDVGGDTLSRTYNSQNQILTSTVYATPAGTAAAQQPQTTSYVYDADNRNLLRFVITPEGRVTEYRYNDQGLRISSINYPAASDTVDQQSADGTLTEGTMQQWVQAQDLTQSQRTDVAYDFRGQLQSSTTYGAVDAAGDGVVDSASVVQYVYDQRGQLLQTVTPDRNGQTQTVYDGLGRVLAVTAQSTDGALSTTTVTQYDDANGTIAVTLANGLTTTSAYDYAGRLLSVSQTNGGDDLGVTSYSYDADGHLLMTQDPTGQRSWMLYDAQGRKVADINAAGSLTEYVYNAGNLVTETIGYDTKIDTSVLVDADGNTTTAYNGNPDAAPSGVTAVTLASIRPASTAQDAKLWTIYDVDQRPQWQVDGLGNVTHTQYDGAGRVLSVTKLATPIDVTQLGNGQGIDFGSTLAGKTTTQLTSSTNYGAPNAPLTLVAKVTGVEDGSIVTFYNGDTAVGTAETINGLATLVTVMPTGQIGWTAKYDGDDTHAASVSGLITTGQDPLGRSGTIVNCNADDFDYYDGTRDLVFQVQDQATGQNVTGGTLSLFSGQILIGSAVVSNYGAGVILKPGDLPAGANAIYAVYSGDDNNAPVTSFVKNIDVAGAPSTVSLSMSAPGATGGDNNFSTAYGQAVTLTATVNALGRATPTGTIDFYDDSDGSLIGTAALVDGKAVATFNNLLPGSHTFEAVYDGDGIYASTSSGGSETDTVAQAVTELTPVSTSPIGPNGVIAIQLSGISIPTGQVTFYAGEALLGSAYIINGVATLAGANLAPGDVAITATFDGDGNNIGNSLTFTQTVTDSGSQPVVAVSTYTSLGTSGTAAYGQPLTLTATVDGTTVTGAATPSGSVTFYNGTTVLGIAELINGQASLDVSNLAPGDAVLSAVYGGSDYSVGSNSDTTDMPVAVAQSTVALTSVEQDNAQGPAYTLTVQVGGYNPSGLVTFFNGTTLLGMASVVDGQASLSGIILPVGVNTLSAAYVGDSNNAASTPTSLQQAVATASSIPLSSWGTTEDDYAYGALFDFGPNNAGGPVELGAYFFDTQARHDFTGETVSFFSGQTLLGTTVLDASGNATLTVSNLSRGNNLISAVYSGDSQLAVHQTREYSIDIDGVISTVALTATSADGTVGTDGGTFAFGQDITLTAAVDGQAGVPPTGTVDFYDGNLYLGQATIVDGQANFTVGNLTVGEHDFNAIYNGDAQYASGNGSETNTVAQAASTLTPVSTSPIGPNGVIAVQVNGITLPTGQVTFYAGEALLGSAYIINGVATLAGANLVPGDVAITATFDGDANNIGNSLTFTQTVTDSGSQPVVAVPTYTSLATSGTAAYGQPLTLTATVDGTIVTGAGAPSGSVTFYNGITVLGTAELINGQASLDVSNLAPGDAVLSAVYGGSDYSVGSNSDTTDMPVAVAQSTVALTSVEQDNAQGPAYTLTVQVTGDNPTGLVTFFSGTTLLGTASVVNGQASLSNIVLPVGVNTLSAAYAGDSNNAISAPVSLQQNVLTASSAATSSWIGTGSDYPWIQEVWPQDGGGDTITLPANVRGWDAGSHPVTGTVSFFSGETLLGSVTLDANGDGALTISRLPKGDNLLTAVYSGDSQLSAGYGSHVVSIRGARSFMTLAATAADGPDGSTSTYGQSIMFTATVAGQVGVQPTGTIAFYDGSLYLGQATIVDGQASLVVGNPASNHHSFRVVYNGDTLYESGGSSINDPAGHAVTTLAPVSTNPIDPNGVIAVQVQGVAVTGSVTFYSGQNIIGSATVINGVATLAGMHLPIGDASITASYSGDTINAGSELTFTQNVANIANPPIVVVPTTTTLLSSITYDAGQTVTLKAIVDGTTVTGAAHPSGSVTFYNGSTVLGTAELINGNAWLDVSNLPVGTATLSAIYAGDQYSGSSASDSISLPVELAQSILTFTSSAQSAAQGSAVTFTAQVTGGDLSGLVTFFNGTTPLGTATVVNGQAVLTVSNLPVGANTISATYTGNSATTSTTFTTFSVAAPLVQTITQTASALTLTGSTDTSLSGAPLVLTAQFTGSTVTPTGNVTFYDGATAIGTATLINGLAAITISNLSAGSHALTASYDGDGNTAASTSAAFTEITGLTHIEALTAADDRTVSRIYDNDGLLRAMIDPEGYLTEYRYDAAGQEVQTIAYAGKVAGFDDAAGFSTALATARATDSLADLLPAAGNSDISTFTFYNDRHQIIGQVDGEGYLTEIVYDANGNVAQNIRYANHANTPVSVSSTLSTLRPSSSAQDQVQSNTWDALGRLASKTSVEGTVTQYSYDSVGNVIRTVIAPNTRDMRTQLVQYDVQGNVTAALSGVGAALITGNQTADEIDAIWAQYATTYNYDAAGRRISAIDANGNWTEFFYDDAGRLTDTVNALGDVLENTYDALGRLIATTRYATDLSADVVNSLEGGLLSADGNQTAIQALAAAKQAGVGVAGSLANTTNTFTYDADGELISATDALGGISTNSYDAFGDVTGTVQAINDTQTATNASSYDRRGQQIGTVADVDQINATNSYQYDAFGRLIGSTDANGNVTQDSYDRLGRVVQIIDPNNAVRSSTYDAFGQVLTQTDALGNTTTYSYDTANRSMTVTLADGVSMTTIHNREGQTQRVTDGNGNTTAYSYDQDGNLLSTQTPLTMSSKEYDAADNLIRTTDGNGKVVAYRYDAANRLLTQIVDPGPSEYRPLRLTTGYEYDAKGEKISITDPNGVVTQIAYDAKGEVLSQTVDPSDDSYNYVGANLTTSYTYDARGKVLTVSSPGGTVTQYVYDDLGRRIQTITDPTGLALTQSYAYDQDGNVVASTDPNGNVTRYVYDADNRLVYTIDGLGEVKQNTYDADGRVTGTTAYAHPISLVGLSAPSVSDVAALITSDANGDRVQLRAYDNIGRLTYTADAAGDVTGYSYDGNGNVVNVTRYANPIDLGSWASGTAPNVVADASRDESVSTVYDALNRAVYTLTSAGDGSQLTVVAQTYDGNGNILRRTSYANTILVNTALTIADVAAAVENIANATLDSTTLSAYDAANRLIWSVDGTGDVVGYGYDSNGNLTNRVSYAKRINPKNWIVGERPPIVVDGLHDHAIRIDYDTSNRAIYTFTTIVGGRGDANLYAATASTYDANGNLVGHTAYANALWEASARDIQSDAADMSTHAIYDAANRLIWSVDGAGSVVQRNYDQDGNVVRQIQYANPIAPGTTPDSATGSPGDRVTIMAYDPAGRMTYRVDALGDVSQTVYDATGNVVKLIDYATPVAAPSADATIPTMAEVAANLSTSAADRVTTMTYDTAGRMIYRIDALGDASQNVYDGIGNVVKKIDYATRVAAPTVNSAVPTMAEMAANLSVNTADRTTYAVFDSAGQQVYSIDAAGTVSQNTYDAFGNVIVSTVFSTQIDTSGLPSVVDTHNVEQSLIAQAGGGDI